MERGDLANLTAFVAVADRRWCADLFCAAAPAAHAR